MVDQRANSASWKLNLVFEYMIRDLPQQNSLVEVSFTTIGNRGQAMMITANVPYKISHKSRALMKQG
eukprot:10995420-Ditylum_brightwellii.AAC.2